MKKDPEFVEKVRSIGFVQKYKPGSTRTTEVIRDDDGKRAGQHTEHYDGSQDAVAEPRTLRMRVTQQEGD